MVALPQYLLITKQFQREGLGGDFDVSVFFHACREKWLLGVTLFLKIIDSFMCTRASVFEDEYAKKPVLSGTGRPPSLMALFRPPRFQMPTVVIFCYCFSSTGSLQRSTIVVFPLFLFFFSFYVYPRSGEVKPSLPGDQ